MYVCMYACMYVCMVCKVWFIGSFWSNKPGFSIILIYWIKKCYNKLKWKDLTWSVQKKIYSNIGRCCNKPLFIATCDLHRFCTKWEDAQSRLPLSFHMCDSWFEYPVYLDICTKELSIWQLYYKAKVAHSKHYGRNGLQFFDFTKLLRNSLKYSFLHQIIF